MPRLVSMQAMWWGMLPSSVIPFDPYGVNALVGANGGSKSTMLDAIKLLLGQTEFDTDEDDEQRTAAGYITGLEREDDPNGAVEVAEFALVMGVFLNGPGPRGRRSFAQAGPRCVDAEHVSIVARVRPDGVQWTVLDGIRRWGGDGRDLSADVRAMAERPQREWWGSVRHGQLLASAGISSSMRKVLAVGQGRATAALKGDDRERLRHLAQLLGNENAIVQLDRARADYARTREDVDRANDDLEGARTELEATRSLAASHELWVRAQAQETFLLRWEVPAAIKPALSALRAKARAQEDEAAASATRAPSLVGEIATARRQQIRVRGSLNEAGDQRELAAIAADGAERALLQAQQAIAAAADASPPAITSARDEQRATAARLAAAMAHEQALTEERDALAAGRHPAPATARALGDALSALAIDHRLLADVVDPPPGSELSLDARLGDAVWAIGVAPPLYDHAREEAARWPGGPPLVRLDDHGHGFGSFLAELPDVPGEEVAPGVLEGAAFVWHRGVDPPRVGPAARERRLRTVLEQLDAAHKHTEEASDGNDTAQAALARVEAAADARERLSVLELAHTDAQAALAVARDSVEATNKQLTDLATKISKLEAERDDAVETKERLERERRATATQIERLSTDLAEVAEVEPLVGPVRTLATLDALRGLLAARIEVTSEDAKDPALPGRLIRSEARFADLRDKVEGAPQRIEEVNEQLELSRRLFNEHVRTSMRALGKRFGELCAEVAMDGRVVIVDLDEDDFAVRIDVRATGGKRHLRMGSGKHSGGQRAKAAIILLLACMSLGDTADLLISDEPGAHLDARNLRDVGEAMQRMSDRVQVIIAAPIDAEARRMDWTGHFLLFTPSEPGDPDYPYVRIAVVDRELDADASS